MKLYEIEELLGIDANAMRSATRGNLAQAKS